ncbi:cytochrome P450 [Saccharothrix violaceirubra]|uniref:Cytochrome P450 n=1 Tax=Saccharothrix violaceirubra TaxID=413306 RepID=A0A7W7WWP1_9PSEU|nr:cytochrome P450 [Saccharothrix violaceirubra]MBB4965808.1 cytochrome P450 [Saccharothrix violaceirubra]
MSTTASSTREDAGEATAGTESTNRERIQLPAELMHRDAGRPFDPPVALDRLADTGPAVQPITQRDGDTAWLVTGYAEGRAVLADPRFSSERFTARVLDKLSPEIRARVLDPDARAGSFIFMDPPDHTRYRRLLTGQFTVRRMRQLEPRIEAIVAEHIDAMIAKGPGADLVTEFALPVPSLVICELLGVEYADRDEFQDRTAKLLALDSTLEEVFDASDNLRKFMHRLVERKRAQPTDDILSGLVHAETDTPLTDAELVGIANLLLIAGHETTANMLALGTFALLEKPDQLAALRADPALIGGAVEELLRYLAIVHLGIVRTTLEDVEISGVTIPADSTVFVSVTVANRDGRVVDDPDRLDVTRPRAPHLAFGHGIHQCLGQQLARVEMTAGFTGLLGRLPGLRLDVDPADVPLRDDMAIYGVHSLPVTWDA